ELLQVLRTRVLRPLDARPVVLVVLDADAAVLRRAQLCPRLAHPELQGAFERRPHRGAGGQVVERRLRVLELAHAAVEPAPGQSALAVDAALLGAEVAVVAVGRHRALAPAAGGAAVAVGRVAVVALLARIDVAVATERAERGDRVGRLPGDVDVVAVGADGDGRGAGEAVDGADEVVLRLDEGEAAGGRIAIERPERIAGAGGAGDVGRAEERRV